ncbi:hypothetical protein FACS189431_1990 [Alphaproteobacteria bacterium]|nr:hypothetical protein FACS189431_1990 [Alphaproteobacteria bacterium]
MNNQEYADNLGQRLDKESLSSDNASGGVEMADVTLLTIKQAEALLKISNWGLYQLIRDNVIPTVKIGGRRLLRLSTLQNYINKLEDKSRERGNYGY